MKFCKDCCYCRIARRNWLMRLLYKSEFSPHSADCTNPQFSFFNVITGEIGYPWCGPLRERGGKCEFGRGFKAREGEE